MKSLSTCLLFASSLLLALLLLFAASELHAQGVTFQTCSYKPPGTDYMMTLGFSSTEMCLSYVKHVVVNVGPQVALHGYPQCSQNVYCFAGISTDLSWAIRNANSNDVVASVSVGFYNNRSDAPNMQMSVSSVCSWLCNYDKNDQSTTVYDRFRIKCNSGGSNYDDGTFLGPLTHVAAAGKCYFNLWSIQPQTQLPVF